MKKILISILAIIVVFIAVSAIVPNRTYAIGLDDMQKKAQSFFNKGKPEADNIATEHFGRKIYPSWTNISNSSEHCTSYCYFDNGNKIYNSKSRTKGKTKTAVNRIGYLYCCYIWSSRNMVNC